MVSADFDGDSDIDVAILHNTDGNGVVIDIHANDGDANFSSVQTLEIGGEASGGVDGDIKVGDIDGDGSPDLIATYKSSYDLSTFAYTYSALTFTNDGSGTFEEKQALDDVGGIEIELMDVDSDDDLDLLISNTAYPDGGEGGCCFERLGDEEQQNYIRVFYNSNAAPTGIELSIESFDEGVPIGCLLYTSPSPRDRQKSRMPSSA